MARRKAIKKKTIKKTKTAKSKKTAKPKKIEKGHSKYYKGLLTAKVPKHHNFVLADGQQVKSLIELAYRLDYMHQGVFHHHTKKGRNDFANWAREVYHDEKLARRLEKSHSRQDTQVTILKQLISNLRK